MYGKKFVSSCSLVLASAIVLAGPSVAKAQEDSSTPSSADNTNLTAQASNETNVATQASTNTETTTPGDQTDTTNTTSPTATDTELAPETAATTSTPEATTTTETPTSSDELVILHTNDIHGRLEEVERSVIGVAKLDAIVQTERASNPNTLVLDAGDAFQGLPISNATKGEDMAKIMNAIGYDAMTVGNHEFDFSLEQARKYKELLNFPILSSNTYIDDVRVFDASTIIDKTPDIDGDEVVVIGVTTPETSTKTHPNNIIGVTFADPITEVKKVVEAIEAQATAQGKTYNKYVILAHLGIDETTKTEWRGSTLAQSLSSFAPLANKQVVVIDGHSHSTDADKYGHVAYTQTGSYLSNIGKVTFKANNAIETGLISKADTDDVLASENIAQLVTEIKDKFAAENAEVYVENNPVLLQGERSSVRVRETNLGNLVADALYNYGQTGFANTTDLAVTNGGGLRASLVKDAPITKGDVIAVLPFGNIITQIAVTGQQVQDMFAHALSADTQTVEGSPVLDENRQPLLEAAGNFLHISGARVYFDTNLSNSDRILKIKILDKNTGAYVDLDLTKTYYLATNDFLATGGDGYTMLGGPREEGPSMDEVFGQYIKTRNLKEFETINPSTRLISMAKDAYVAFEAEDGLDDLVTSHGEGTTAQPPVAFDQWADEDKDGYANIIEVLYGSDYQNADSKPVFVTTKPGQTPTSPTTPTTPVVPTKPDGAKPGQTDQAGLDGNEKPDNTVAPSPSRPQVQTATVATLPNTGESLPIFTGPALAILLGLGLVTLNPRRRQD
ncbi:TPA: 5'-nucleotidase C-terminal domain-containing protein [Streptococcus suis]